MQELRSGQFLKGFLPLFCGFFSAWRLGGNDTFHRVPWWVFRGPLREQPTKKTRKHQNITVSRRKSEGTSKPRRSLATWLSDKYDQHQQQPTTNKQQTTNNKQQPQQQQQQQQQQQPVANCCKLLSAVQKGFFWWKFCVAGVPGYPSFQSGTFPAVQIHHSARKCGSIYIWVASQKSEELTTEISGCLLTPTSYKSPVKPINFQPFILGESPHLVSGWDHPQS